MQTKKLQHTLTLAILAAMSIVIRLFDFPLLPAAPFLKFDFSDIPAFIGMLIDGPTGLVFVSLIRDLLNYLMKGGEAGIPLGDTMSFIASISMYYPMHFLLKKEKLSTHFFRFKSGIILILSLTLSLCLFNYFVALPLYIKLLSFPIDSIRLYVLTLIVPFNLIKGFILVIVQSFLLNYLVPMLNSNNRVYKDYIQ